MKILVLCEADPAPAMELIGQARKMAPQAAILALCEGRENARLLAAGADELLLIGQNPDDSAQGSRIAAALASLNPDAALFPATVRGRFLSAWAAARLDTGLTADCTGLEIRDGLLLQTRPAFGGNLTAEILCRHTRPQMASVRPGVFPMPEEKQPAHHSGDRVSALTLRDVMQRMERLTFVPVEQGVSLQNARVVIAGGKGIGSKEGFDRLHQLAGLLGGAVGATRSAVDAGYISYDHQVGQTGVTIRPELYIGFGISGFVQHTVGMSGAKTVVSVNTDRNAPVFACSDFGIIADWRQTIDVMIDYLKERKATK